MTATLQDLALSPLAETLREALGSLLHPISTESPAGLSLRYDALYDRIRAARHAENDTLPQGVWQRELPQADWAAVDELTTAALEHRSKDLQLAIWRTEALLHLHGLTGLTGGAQLLLGLHCFFAPTMHPAPEGAATTLPLDGDDPGIEARLNLVQWINDKLSVQLKLLPITAPDELTGIPAFTFADMEAARLQHQHSSTKPGEIRLELFEQSLARTPGSWFDERWSELQHAAETVTLLDEVLDTVYGPANGGLLKVRKVLEEMSTVVLAALPAALPASARTSFVSVAEQPASAPESTALSFAGPALHKGEFEALPLAESDPFPIRSRAEAYRRLAEISEFLARLEPHSPVPYLLQRAIAWGGMSLEELLPELLSDQAAVRDVGNLLRLNESVRK